MYLFLYCFKIKYTCIFVIYVYFSWRKWTFVPNLQTMQKNILVLKLFSKMSLFFKLDFIKIEFYVELDILKIEFYVYF